MGRDFSTSPSHQIQHGKSWVLALNAFKNAGAVANLLDAHSHPLQQGHIQVGHRCRVRRFEVFARIQRAAAVLSV